MNFTDKILLYTDTQTLLYFDHLGGLIHTDNALWLVCSVDYTTEVPSLPFQVTLYFGKLKNVLKFKVIKVGSAWGSGGSFLLY